MKQIQACSLCKMINFDSQLLCYISDYKRFTFFVWRIKHLTNHTISILNSTSFSSDKLIEHCGERVPAIFQIELTISVRYYMKPTWTLGKCQKIVLQSYRQVYINSIEKKNDLIKCSVCAFDIPLWTNILFRRLKSPQNIIFNEMRLETKNLFFHIWISMYSYTVVSFSYKAAYNVLSTFVSKTFWWKMFLCADKMQIFIKNTVA